MPSGASEPPSGPRRARHRRPLRGRLASGAALVATVVVAGIGVVAALPAAQATVVAAPPGRPIVWGECPQEVVAAAEGSEYPLTCGVLRVPLDYRNPAGRTIGIAVSRLATAKPGTRRGVMLLNPGGPGASGLGLPVDAARLMSPEVLASYDLIGFDPRGVAHSTPVTCGLTGAAASIEFAFPAADGSITRNVADARSIAEGCARNSGDLLPYITTVNTARDMDQIRQALGQRRVSYLGISYGTYLGAVYASMFPDRTDRVVLDSNIDPTKVWYDAQRSFAPAVEIGFRDAAEYVAARPETFRFGRTGGEVEANYLALARRLDAAPIPLAGDWPALTGDLLRYVTVYQLYGQEPGMLTLGRLWRAAADYSPGADSSQLAELIGEVGALESSNVPGVPQDNNTAMIYAINCGDASWPGDIATYLGNVTADRERYPLTAGAPSNIGPCAFWKTRPIEPPVKVTSHGKRNILLLNNRRDPATSWAGALGMRAALGRHVAIVAVDTAGHGAYVSSECARILADAFLADGRYPAGDRSCPKP